MTRRGMRRDHVTSSRGPATPLREAFQRSGEILGQPRERNCESGTTAHQHIVTALMEASSGGKPHDFLQPPAYAVAFDGVADLPGNRKPDPCRTAIATAAFLHYKSRRRCMIPGGGSKKIVPSPQSFHRTDIWLPAQVLPMR
jgi:hypothetical protein